MSSMGAPASPVEMRAAYSSAAGSEVVLFAASDGGFFTRNGLDVSMTRISGLDPRTLIDDSVVIEAEKGLQGR